jgi:long-chain acyl-CoA synthetase
MVVGDKQPFIAALITLDPEALPAWLKQHGRDEQTPLVQLAADPAVLHEVEAAVAKANEAVSKAESIRKFTVLPVEWTIEAGQITPSMKIKRNVIAAQFLDEIDKLYVK